MPPCAGDCDGDSHVVVSEFVIGVNIVLGNFTARRCPAFDPDGDGQVLVNDLIRAVQAALSGCPVTPTPTPTSEPDCPDPGANPATGCTSCKPRFHVENAFGIPAPEGLSDGDEEPDGAPPSSSDERRRCVPDSFCAPSSIHCSGRGTCVEFPGGTAGCDCPDGYGGVNCERCLPPYTPVPGGACVRGGGCSETMCNGHGTCVAVGGTVTCDCDPGFGGARCASSFVLVPVGHSVEVGGTIMLSTVFVGGPSECGPDIDWQIVSGGGSIVGNDTTAPYTAPNAVDGLVDIVTVGAAPENCPELAAATSIHVVLAGVGPIVGHASEEFEDVDEAVLQFMEDHGIPGGTMTLSFQERRVYNKAFGFALPFALPGMPAEMTPGHILRLASVSKPITRAAIRELQAAGTLTQGATGLSDSVFDILQNDGNNLLGLDGDDMPVQPLVDADYFGETPTLCDSSETCPPEDEPPLNCPVGSVEPDSGPLCALNLDNAVDGFTLMTKSWNVDGSNPRVGGSPQYDCPTDDTGQLDVALWQRMTVGDLFWHSGGFYRGANFIDGSGTAQSGDPQAEPILVAQRLPLDHAPPPNALDVIRFAAGTCLYYPPLGCDDTCCVAGSVPVPVDPWGYCTKLGKKDTYSNVGYNILGQVIAVKSGMPYADYVKQTLFDPLGIENILPGKTQPQDRDPREPVYLANGDAMGGNLFAAECEGGNGPACTGGMWTFPQQVNKPDGGNFALEYRNPSGGWTATSCDLNRLFTVYRIADGFRRTAGVFLSEGTMFGSYAGTRAYAAQWGDSVKIADTEDVPDDCTEWDCLDDESVSFDLGPGWHLAALFNKDLCDTGTCDAPGGYVFTKHDESAFLNAVANALTKVTTVPDEEVICGCGNGLIDVGEECDGYDFGGASCTSLGFPGGKLACREDCTFETFPCMPCVDGVREPDKGEVCDGMDFGGQSCADFGFEMGDLICNSCVAIDFSSCSGGMSIFPPDSYKACGFDFEDPDNPADCSGGTCAGADGTCAGGPCKATNPGDYSSALADPLNTQGGEFHPDGNFRSADDTLFFCQLDENDEHMVCIDQFGWGVCKRCSALGGDQTTLVGCPCHSDDECESPGESGLGCFGEDYGGGIGFCWDAQDGPPSWQCPEGICGQAPHYGDDEMFCEHYSISAQPARCEPWFACNSILARVCASNGPGLICAEDVPGCTELEGSDGTSGTADDCCIAECDVDAHCGADFGWPPNFTCEGPDQSNLRCVYTPP